MKKLGHYEIIKVIGATELTMLYLARHIYLDKYVIVESSPMADNELLQKRLKFLAQLLGKLHHPKILPIVDSFEDGQMMYLVFEWSEDFKSLEAIIKQKNHFSLDEVLQFSLDVGYVLNYLHHNGVVHQNLQLTNILIGQNTFYLGGFILANTVQNPFDELRQRLDDARYAAPEWFLREPLCFEQDIWALGVCIYRMLSGKFPFEGDMEKEVGEYVVAGKCKPLGEIMSGLPENVVNLIHRMLSINKAERPSLTEVITTLEGQLYMTPLASAFLAMPFHQQFNRVHQAIRSACQKCRIKPIRVDENIMPSNIWQDIEKGIRESAFVIGDLSIVPGIGQTNPNVSFEVGLAYSLGKPTILLTQDVNTLPFDFRQQRAHVYSNTEENLQEFEKKLTELLQAIMKELGIR